MSQCGYDLSEPQDIIEYLLYGDGDEDWETLVAVRRTALAAIERLQTLAWCEGRDAAAKVAIGHATGEYPPCTTCEEAILALKSPYEAGNDTD